MNIRLSLIAALAPNMGIGEGEHLPWRMPRDMRFFKRMTYGHVVIMGRKTFESLGCKPLPNRVNVVLSRTRNYKANNLIVARSIDEAVIAGSMATRHSRIFVIGGGNVYGQAIDLADEMYLTLVEKAELSEDLFGESSFLTDTFFPHFRQDSWETCHVSRFYRALDSTKVSKDVRPSHYFRFWKLARKTLGRTSREEAHILRRFGTTQLELPFWNPGYAGASESIPKEYFLPSIREYKKVMRGTPKRSG